jgi:uncharacterized membrane protein
VEVQVRRRAERLLDRVRYEPGIAVLAAATTAWIFVMELAVWRRHDRYGTFDQDIGFHTQFIWQLARGRSFSTIVGVPAFGHNSTLGYFLLVPLSWLHLDGVQTLDLLQTLVVAGGVLPIYVLARRRLGSGWPATILPLAWLLHPVVQDFVWETWHPEVIATTFLLCAYAAADDWKWRRYWLFVVLAIIWKNDVALFVFMLGIWVTFRRNKKVGRRTMALGAAWFLAASVLIPHIAGGSTVYGILYGDLGDTPVQVAKNSVLHPSRLVQHLRDAHPIQYGRDMTAPYGFIPWLAPVQIGLALPQIAIDVLPTELPDTRLWTYAPHYQAMPMAALTIALVEGTALLHRRRRALRNPACAFLLACGLASSVAWGALPGGVRWHYYWSEDDDPTRAAKDAAVALVGPSAPVSANYLITAHLAQRELVYTFPNPWRRQYWGVVGSDRPDPAAVQLIVLDEGIISPSEQEVEACIVASGAFEEAYRNGQIVVLERIPEHEPTDVDCV